jgi:hypothetical protein
MSNIQHSQKYNHARQCNKYLNCGFLGRVNTFYSATAFCLIADILTKCSQHLL